MSYISTLRVPIQPGTGSAIERLIHDRLVPVRQELLTRGDVLSMTVIRAEEPADTYEVITHKEAHERNEGARRSGRGWRPSLPIWRVHPPSLAARRWSSYAEVAEPPENRVGWLRSDRSRGRRGAVAQAPARRLIGAGLRSASRAGPILARVRRPDPPGADRLSH